jgi:hypothetical protein
MILRLLGVQGIAGIAVSLALAILLFVQKAETRHWKKQSAGFDQLYTQEKAAFAATAANVRAAAETARAVDAANAARVAAEQRTINERTADDFETRLAAARVRAEQLRLQSPAAADPGARRGPLMPGLSAAAGSAAQGAAQDRLPSPDALTATQQAIQLDELIKWVKAQAKVDNEAATVASSSEGRR